MVTQALVPAAGRGARLDRPDTPKPLVDVGGRPLIVDVLKKLQRAGIDEAVVVVGFGADEIVRELTNHPKLDLAIEFVEHGGWQRGLASSILAARDELDDRFVVAMADHRFESTLVDTITGVDLDGDAGVMLVDRDVDSVHDPDAAVGVRLDDRRVIDVDRELDDDADGVDAGILLLESAIFEALESVLVEDEPAGLADAMRQLADAGHVRATFVDGARWYDIDTPSALIRAEMDHRDRRRKETVTEPKFDDNTAVEPTNYVFTTGKPTDTDVFVQRGFVRNPKTIQLIPDESASSPIYVFTDTRVNELYGDDFVGGLDEMGYDVRRIVMAEGEESKTMQNYTELVDHVLAEGIDERSVMVSLGGGAVCNVCGFVASTLYRGIGLVHVPTTLMAQCDAAIGHKQGINGSRGKNMVGAYYPPHAIAVDVEVLETLEDWLIPDGLSEVVKHALGQDREYLDYLLDYDGSMFDFDFLEHVVCKNIELKCELMASDPKELKEGMVLQYGHTTGHPIEYLSGYDLNHGQCVGIGMMVASRIGRMLGACDDDMVELHREVIEKYDLPTTIPEYLEVDDIMAALKYNKRYLTEGTRMAIVDEPGSLWQIDGDYTIPVPEEVLREALHASF